MLRIFRFSFCLVLLVACADEGDGDAGMGDAGNVLDGALTQDTAAARDVGLGDASDDASLTDSGGVDVGVTDSGTFDASVTDGATDASTVDAGVVDAATDAGSDASADAGSDAGAPDAGPAPVTCMEAGLVARTITDSASSGTPDTYFFDVTPGDPFCAEITGGGGGSWGVTVSNGTSGGIYCSNTTPCRIRVPAGEPTLLVTALTDDIGSYRLTVHSIPR